MGSLLCRLESGWKCGCPNHAMCRVRITHEPTVGERQVPKARFCNRPRWDLDQNHERFFKILGLHHCQGQVRDRLLPVLQHPSRCWRKASTRERYGSPADGVRLPDCGVTSRQPGKALTRNLRKQQANNFRRPRPSLEALYLEYMMLPDGSAASSYSSGSVRYRRDTH